MGQVHQLILTQGIEQAKAQSLDPLERQCIETAFAVMSDTEQQLGFMHAGFAMTALPHRAVPDPVWIRQGANVRLKLESGTDPRDRPVGLPYGAVARIILLYLQTRAVKTKSREIELGRSMRLWLTSMGLETGGENYRLVREQSRRLSLCRLTFYNVLETATVITNGSFVRTAIIPHEEEGEQLALWQEAVRLDEGFYQSLIDHPLPLREAAIRQIARRSMAIDIYIWLAYRLHKLDKPLLITWKALYGQFGAGFQRIRAFREKLKEPLALALAAYPEAFVELDNVGVRLHPSPPPVAEQFSRGATILRIR
jgi:hypothetical protein